MKTKLYLLTGFLGSGKTTLLLDLHIDEGRYKMYNLNIDNYQYMRWDYEN